MKKYIVNIREVHLQPIEIEAESPEEAIRLVQDGDGEGDYTNGEYSHTLDSDTWTVEEKKENEE